jgi:thiamine-phosphate pyrophosphorylase
MFRLYLITAPGLVDDLPRAVERALAGIPPGAAALQLREKDRGGRALLELAEALRPICRQRDAPLLINDRLDVALAAGADGVHLAGSSLPTDAARALLGDRLIGASCHSPAELRERAGVDFATYGPVFATPGKGPAIGLAGLREARGSIPLFALGGVEADVAKACVDAGAHGIAAIRAWLAAPDPAEAAAALLDAVSTRIE